MNNKRSSFFRANFMVFMALTMIICVAGGWAFVEIGKLFDENVSYQEKQQLISTVNKKVKESINDDTINSWAESERVQGEYAFITAFGITKNKQSLLSWGHRDKDAELVRMLINVNGDQYITVMQVRFTTFSSNEKIWVALGVAAVAFILISVVAKLTIITPIQYVLNITEVLSKESNIGSFSLGKWYLFGSTRMQLQHLHKLRDIFIERERKVLNITERLNYSQTRDFLTGLPNQVLFYHLIEQVREQRKNRLSALLYIDLDGFGAINELNGHEYGDGVIKLASRRVNDYSKRVDGICGRTQGDTFMLFTTIESEEQVKEYGLELVELVAGDYEIGTVKVNITAVVGGAVLHEEDSIRDALEKVHTAVYAAKRSGKACYMDYLPELREAHARRAKIRQELVDAIEEEKLSVVFQPIMNLTSGKIAGVEALTRWEDDNGEAIYHPDEFISVAEESGLIDELDKLVLNKACNAIKRLNDSGHDIFVSINFSATNFNKGKAKSVIEKAIQSSGISTSNIEIEITERSVLNQQGAIDQLEAIRNLGVGISIDDFGVGYSSLASVREYCRFITKLKLDKSFIDALNDANDEVGTKVIDVIFGLARSMKVEAIAEGIETKEQNQRLIELGCEFGQGWLFEKAISERKLKALLDDKLTILHTVNGKPLTKSVAY